MTEELTIRNLREDIDQIAVDAVAYFGKARNVLLDVPRANQNRYSFENLERDHFWNILPESLRSDASSLIERLISLAGRLASLVKSAPLASEGDQRDLMAETKAMRAALRLRHFRHWDTEVLHDEGTVLGVHPAGQSDDNPSPPEDAERRFAQGHSRILSIFELVAATNELSAAPAIATPSTNSSRYRPSTAFIMMWMDKSQPELDDICDTVKSVFAAFNVRAIRADDIEHEELITQRILDEITTAEFLFADLTGARPSVYYEVGYAHALGKRVILFRKAGTGLHFDLAGYNCPEYENLRELKEKLTRRLEHLTNKKLQEM